MIGQKWEAGTDIVEWSVKKWRAGLTLFYDRLEPTLSNDRVQYKMYWSTGEDDGNGEEKCTNIMDNDYWTILKW